MTKLTVDLLGKALLKAFTTTLVIGLATTSPFLIGSAVSSISEVSSNGEFFIYGISLLAGTFTFMKYKKSSYGEIFHDLYNVFLVIFICVLILGYVGILVDSESAFFILINDYSVEGALTAALLYFISQTKLNYKILLLEYQQDTIDNTSEDRNSESQSLENRVEW